jgi:hypothetical protein
MVEEMMDLETCRYIDFPGVRVIDLKVPQLPEKEYEATTKWTSNVPTIMETIASVSKALQKYERTGGFASSAAIDAKDATLAAPAAHVEPTENASVLPQANEGREALPPLSVETAGASTPVAEPGAAEVVVRGEGTLPLRRVAAEDEGIGTLVFDEPATVAQESAVPETMTRVTTPKIQEAEETGASLAQGVVGGETRTLELACA